MRMQRTVTPVIIGVLVVCEGAMSWAAERTPTQTIEALHAAIRNADSTGVGSVLHPDYHGASLQGPLDHRHVYVETRDSAVTSIAAIRPGDWDVRILHASEQIDANGLAHVWIRYVFYFKGAANHCGHESYDLFRTVEGWKVISFVDSDTALKGQPADSVCPD
jgi:hypothetical protein